MRYLIDGEKKLTENIRLKELSCNDGNSYIRYDQEDIDKLQKIREFFNKPLFIVSAYRPPAYNKMIGGSPTSFHLIGKAYDIKISGVSPALVGYIGWKVGFKGCGIYHDNSQSFTHLDSRESERLFRDDLLGSGTFKELEEKILRNFISRGV